LGSSRKGTSGRASAGPKEKAAVWIYILLDRRFRLRWRGKHVTYRAANGRSYDEINRVVVGIGGRELGALLMAKGCEERISEVVVVLQKFRSIDCSPGDAAEWRCFAYCEVVVTLSVAGTRSISEGPRDRWSCIHLPDDGDLLRRHVAELDWMCFDRGRYRLFCPSGESRQENQKLGKAEGGEIKYEIIEGVGKGLQNL
jgi:hypothetical protein